MFIVFGTRPVYRDVKHRAAERMHCARCGLISDFRQQRKQTFATLFFLPVIPISKADSVITCNRCGATYYANHRGFDQQTSEPTNTEKAVLVCPACSGKMRVPVKLENAIRVTCPHCRDQFTVSVNKA